MTHPPSDDSSRGATFSEVLVSLALTMIGVTGAMGAFQFASQSFVQGEMGTRALAMVESRLEAKRSVRWDQLLIDDLDHDGVLETRMHDDGANGDLVAGDGIYSADLEQAGVILTWTVAPNRPGGLSSSGFVTLEARASYESVSGLHEIRIATIRANPMFTGSY